MLQLPSRVYEFFMSASSHKSEIVRRHFFFFRESQQRQPPRHSKCVGSQEKWMLTDSIISHGVVVMATAATMFLNWPPLWPP